MAERVKVCTAQVRAARAVPHAEIAIVPSIRPFARVAVDRVGLGLQLEAGQAVAKGFLQHEEEAQLRLVDLAIA
jgi:hypothetical protein